MDKSLKLLEFEDITKNTLISDVLLSFDSVIAGNMLYMYHFGDNSMVNDIDININMIDTETATKLENKIKNYTDYDESRDENDSHGPIIYLVEYDGIMINFVLIDNEIYNKHSKYAIKFTFNEQFKIYDKEYILYSLGTELYQNTKKSDKRLLKTYKKFECLTQNINHYDGYIPIEEKMVKLSDGDKMLLQTILDIPNLIFGGIFTEQYYNNETKITLPSELNLNKTIFVHFLSSDKLDRLISITPDSRDKKSYRLFSHKVTPYEITFECGAKIIFKKYSTALPSYNNFDNKYVSSFGLYLTELIEDNNIYEIVHLLDIMKNVNIFNGEYDSINKLYGLRMFDGINNITLLDEKIRRNIKNNNFYTDKYKDTKEYVERNIKCNKQIKNYVNKIKNIPVIPAIDLNNCKTEISSILQNANKIEVNNAGFHQGKKLIAHLLWTAINVDNWFTHKVNDVLDGYKLEIDPEYRQISILCGLFHDIGKCGNRNVKSELKNLGSYDRHPEVGYYYLMDIKNFEYPNMFDVPNILAKKLDVYTMNILGICILLHHDFYNLIIKNLENQQNYMTGDDINKCDLVLNYIIEQFFYVFCLVIKITSRSIVLDYNDDHTRKYVKNIYNLLFLLILSDVLGSQMSSMNDGSSEFIRDLSNEYNVKCDDIDWNNMCHYQQNTRPVNKFVSLEYDTKWKKVINVMLESFDKLYDKFLINNYIYFDFHANNNLSYYQPLPYEFASNYHSHIDYGVRDANKLNFYVPHKGSALYGQTGENISALLYKSIQTNINSSLFENTYDDSIFIFKFNGKKNATTYEVYIFILDNITRIGEYVIFSSDNILYYGDVKSLSSNDMLGETIPAHPIKWIKNKSLEPLEYNIHISKVLHINVLKETKKSDIEMIFGITDIDTKTYPYIYTGSSSNFYKNSSEVIPKQPAFFGLTQNDAHADGAQKYCMSFELINDVDNVIDLNNCYIFNKLILCDNVHKYEILGHSSNIIYPKHDQNITQLVNINDKYKCKSIIKNPDDNINCGLTNTKTYNGRRILQELFVGLNLKLADIFTEICDNEDHKYDLQLPYNEQQMKLTPRDMDGILLKNLGYNGFKNDDYGGRSTGELMLNDPSKYIRYKFGYDSMTNCSIRQKIPNPIPIPNELTTDTKGFEISTGKLNKHVSLINHMILDNTSAITKSNFTVSTFFNSFNIVDNIKDIIKCNNDEKLNETVTHIKNKYDELNKICVDKIFSSAFDAINSYQGSGHGSINGINLYNDKIIPMIHQSDRSEKYLRELDAKFVDAPDDLVLFRYIESNVTKSDISDGNKFKLIDDLTMDRENIDVGDLIWYPHIISTTIDPIATTFVKGIKFLMTIRIPKGFPILPVNIFTDEIKHKINIDESRFNYIYDGSKHVYQIDLNNTLNKLLKRFADNIIKTTIYDGDTKITEMITHDYRDDKIILTLDTKYEHLRCEFEIILRTKILDLLYLTGSVHSFESKYAIDNRYNYALISNDSFAYVILIRKDNRIEFTTTSHLHVNIKYSLYKIAKDFDELESLLGLREYEILLRGCVAFKCVNTTNINLRKTEIKLLDCVPYIPYYNYYIPFVTSKSRRYNIPIMYDVSSDTATSNERQIINAKYQIPCISSTFNNVIDMMKTLYDDKYVYNNNDNVSYELYILNTLFDKNVDKTLDQREIFKNNIVHNINRDKQIILLIDIDDSIVKFKLNKVTGLTHKLDDHKFDVLRESLKKSGTIDIEANKIIGKIKPKGIDYVSFVNTLPRQEKLNLFKLIADAILEVDCIISEQTRIALQILKQLNVMIIPFTSNRNYYGVNHELFVIMLNKIVGDEGIFTHDYIKYNEFTNYDNKQNLLAHLMENATFSGLVRGGAEVIHIDDNISKLNNVTTYIYNEYYRKNNMIYKQFHPLQINIDEIFGLSDVVRIMHTFKCTDIEINNKVDHKIKYDDFKEIQTKVFSYISNNMSPFASDMHTASVVHVAQTVSVGKFMTPINKYNINCLDPLLQFNSESNTGSYVGTTQISVVLPISKRQTQITQIMLNINKHMSKNTTNKINTETLIEVITLILKEIDDNTASDDNIKDLALAFNVLYIKSRPSYDLKINVIYKLNADKKLRILNAISKYNLIIENPNMLYLMDFYKLMIEHNSREVMIKFVNDIGTDPELNSFRELTIKLIQPPLQMSQLVVPASTPASTPTPVPSTPLIPSLLFPIEDMKKQINDNIDNMDGDVDMINKTFDMILNIIITGNSIEYGLIMLHQVFDELNKISHVLLDRKFQDILNLPSIHKLIILHHIAGSDEDSDYENVMKLYKEIITHIDQEELLVFSKYIHSKPNLNEQTEEIKSIMRLPSASLPLLSPHPEIISGYSIERDQINLNIDKIKKKTDYIDENTVIDTINMILRIIISGNTNDKDIFDLLTACDAINFNVTWGNKMHENIIKLSSNQKLIILYYIVDPKILYILNDEFYNIRSLYEIILTHMDRQELLIFIRYIMSDIKHEYFRKITFTILSTMPPVPSTPVPSTPVPSTPVPSTPVPSTPVPSTPVPSTPVPSTPVPSTPVPSTPVPSTPVTSIPVPSTPAPHISLSEINANLTQLKADITGQHGKMTGGQMNLFLTTLGYLSNEQFENIMSELKSIVTGTFWEKILLFIIEKTSVSHIPDNIIYVISRIIASRQLTPASVIRLINYTIDNITNKTNNIQDIIELLVNSLNNYDRQQISIKLKDLSDHVQLNELQYMVQTIININ
jgi:hypothetical protein